jgi:hypothetical protein
MKIFKLSVDLNNGSSHYADIPAGATFLTIQLQLGVPCIWFLCDPDVPIARRRIDVYGTGHELPPNPGKYIDTVQFVNEGIVLHFFEVDQ